MGEIFDTESRAEPIPKDLAIIFDAPLWPLTKNERRNRAIEPAPNPITYMMSNFLALSVLCNSFSKVLLSRNALFKLSIKPLNMPYILWTCPFNYPICFRALNAA